MVSTKI